MGGWRRRLNAVLVGSFMICAVTTTVWATCEDITNQTVVYAIANWRTNTGADSAWVNNIFDGQSGQPSTPFGTWIGKVLVGSTFKAGLLAAIQDASDSECDDVSAIGDIRNYLQPTCIGSLGTLASPTYHVNTCALGGSNHFYGQKTVVANVNPGSGHQGENGFASNAVIYRNGVLSAQENQCCNSCFKVFDLAPSFDCPN